MTTTIQTFDYAVDLLRAILWQYQNATRIQTLLGEKQAWYDKNQTQFWTDWQRDVFDLRTCNNFGLAVWAIILGQPIVFTNIPSPSNPTWGFGAYHRNFERGNFSTGREAYTLSVKTARIVLRLRYYILTGTMQVPSINRALKDIFADDYGMAWVEDNHDMTQSYKFAFVPPSDLAFCFDHFDVLPRPSTVQNSWETVLSESWGFGPKRQNFGHGNFLLA